MSSPTRSSVRYAAPLAALGLALGAVACSSDDAGASTCDEAQAFAESLRSLVGVDVVSSGTDGLNEALDEVESSWDGLEAAAKDQFGTEVEALDSALGDAVSTIEALPESGSLSEAGESIRSVVVY